MNEEKCSRVAHLIDRMPSDERKFALWYLLKEYKETDLKIPEHANSVDEYRKMIFTRDLNVSVNHIIELIGFDLWG